MEARQLPYIEFGVMYYCKNVYFGNLRILVRVAEIAVSNPTCLAVFWMSLDGGHTAEAFKLNGPRYAG